MAEALWAVAAWTSSGASLYLLAMRLKDWRISRASRDDRWRQLAGEQSLFDQIVLTGFNLLLAAAVARALFVPATDSSGNVIRTAFTAWAMVALLHTWMSVRQRQRLIAEKQREFEVGLLEDMA